MRFFKHFVLCLEILFYMLREYRRYAFLLFNLHPVGVLFLLFFFFLSYFLVVIWGYVGRRVVLQGKIVIFFPY